MLQIVLYSLILLLGVTLIKKNLIPNFIKKKLSLLQSFSLFLLLGAMGYKIGSNENIIKNFQIIGFQAFIFATLTCIFSVIVTFLLFRLYKLFLKK